MRLRQAKALPEPSGKGKRAVDFPMTFASWAEDGDRPGPQLQPGCGRLLSGEKGSSSSRTAWEATRTASSRAAWPWTSSGARSRIVSEPGPNDLASAVQAANQQIFETGHRDRSSGLPAMGTTIVALALGRRAAWVHVGDSRLYRMRGGDLVSPHRRRHALRTSDRGGRAGAASICRTPTSCSVRSERSVKSRRRRATTRCSRAMCSCSAATESRGWYRRSRFARSSRR